MARLGKKIETTSDINHNERLEYLGDAVVESITSLVVCVDVSTNNKRNKCGTGFGINLSLGLNASWCKIGEKTFRGFAFYMKPRSSIYKFPYSRETDISVIIIISKVIMSLSFTSTSWGYIYVYIWLSINNIFVSYH